MIGTVGRVVTSGLENVLIVDDHPDVPGEPLIGIVAHQAVSGPLAQETSGVFDCKNTDAVTQRFARPG